MLSFNELGRKGNLGNQMFQFAGLRGIARNRGFDWRIPPQGPHWIHGSQMFELFEMRSLNEASFGFGTGKTYFSPGKKDRRNSTGFEFDSHLFNEVPDNVNLNAFFQSPKYFEAIEDEIRADFSLRRSVFERVREKYPLAAEPFISLHVRRGDYLKFPKHHPVQTIDFYAAALEALPRLQVLITTDDPQWVSEQRLFQQPRFQLVNSGSSKDDFTIQTMATCSVISNSSFGWWGAWLSRSESVVAPANWFGPKLVHQKITDLYPENWLVI